MPRDSRLQDAIILIFLSPHRIIQGGCDEAILERPEEFRRETMMPSARSALQFAGRIGSKKRWTDITLDHASVAGQGIGENRGVDSSRHAVVVFDGECAFCNRWVDFMLRFDRRDVFRFTARQSESGVAFSRHAGLPEGGAGSIIVVKNGQVLLRSAAVLRMLSLLGFPFSLAAVFRLIPTRVRDFVYDFMARNRIRWFGRMEACRLPAPAEHHRFL